MARSAAFALLCTAFALAGCAHTPVTSSPRVAPAVGAAAAFDRPDAIGTRWIATHVDGAPVLATSELTLDFAADSAHGFGGCNGFGGLYDAAHPLALQSPVITVAGCMLPGIEDQEDRFFHAVADMRRAAVDTQGSLRIFDAEGRERARLRRRPPPPVLSQPLPGTRWALESVDGRPLPAGDRVLLEFIDGARFRSVQGCLAYAGTYDVTGDRLHFSSTELVEDRCPQDDDDRGRPSMTYPAYVQQFWSDGARLHFLGRNHRKAAFRLCASCDMKPAGG